MKTLVKLTLVLSVLIAFQSCSKDDAPTPEPMAQPEPEPENNAPTINTQNFMVAEDIADNMPIGTVVASDSDGDAITFSISTNDGSLFEINNEGVLSLDELQALDFETTQSHTITVTVNDGTTSTDAEIIINVTDIDETSFVTTWETTTANETVIIPTRADEYTYDYTIDWGDGTIDSGITGDGTHTYATPDTYTVSISGAFPAIYLGAGEFNPTPEQANSREQIRSIEQWGNIQWRTMELAFLGTNENTLMINATDAPDLSQGTSFKFMFPFIGNLNGNFDHWDVSNINTMESMFTGTPFNQNISAWDVSNVTNMENIFSSSSFNQDISSWNVANVTNMRAMFFDTPFNQDIGNWDISNVTDISFLFANTPFNQDISGWDVSNVTDMGFLFRSSIFNQDISSWDVSNVTNMGSMFNGSLFNQDISSWDVGNVTSMLRMFQDSQFNQDISEWNVANVNSMFGMFRGSSFNQDISSWDVSNVTIMLIMFEDSSFNQNISAWNVANVTNCSNFSLNAALTTANTPNFSNCTP
jgi:surface protein